MLRRLPPMSVRALEFAHEVSDDVAAQLGSAEAGS